MRRGAVQEHADLGVRCDYRSDGAEEHGGHLGRVRAHAAGAVCALHAVHEQLQPEPVRRLHRV